MLRREQHQNQLREKVNGVPGFLSIQPFNQIKLLFTYSDKTYRYEMLWVGKPART